MIGSGQDGAFPDSNLNTGLIHGSLHSDIDGRYVFQFREGAKQGSPDGLWTVVEEIPSPPRPDLQTYITATDFTAAVLDADLLRIVLAGAPLEFTGGIPVRISLPTPNSTFVQYDVVESPIMEDALATQLSDVRTYLGTGVQDRTASLRFTFSNSGFFGQVLSPTGNAFVIPFWHNDDSIYASYFSEDIIDSGQFVEPDVDVLPGTPVPSSSGTSAVVSPLPDVGISAVSSGTQLRTYRIAVAATGEFTAFASQPFAPNANLAQLAIVNVINFVNGIFERDLTTRLILVANNLNLIFLNPATDPYTNNAPLPPAMWSPGPMQGENQNTIDNITIIGSANYDIGHVFGVTPGGGYSGVASGLVGVNANKAAAAFQHIRCRLALASLFKWFPMNSAINLVRGIHGLVTPRIKALVSIVLNQESNRAEVLAFLDT